MVMKQYPQILTNIGFKEVIGWGCRPSIEVINENYLVLWFSERSIFTSHCDEVLYLGVGEAEQPSDRVASVHYIG